MRSKIVTTLAVGALAAAGATVTVETAQAGTDVSARAGGCVTRAEFRAVKRGWPLARVERRIGTHGTLTFQGPGYKSKEYKPCTSPQFGFVMIDYTRRSGAMRLDSKAAYWG